MIKIPDPSGCVVELVEMQDPQAPPEGTLGTVTGLTCFPGNEQILYVRWENGSGLSLLEQDQYKVLTTKNGFTWDSLLSYAYGRFMIRWLKEHQITDECMKETENDWRSCSEGGILESMSFSEYVECFGFSHSGGSVFPTEREFEANEFLDYDVMNSLLGKLAMDAWMEITAERRDHV